MLEVASDDLYQRDPHAILETFLVFQQTVGVKGLSARTLRALYNARDLMDAEFRHDPVNRATFMEILQAPEGQTHAFRLMNQTSVLGRYLWVFRRIVGQMQHDLFHVYTVDQHILMVLRNVRRFFIPEHAHEYPFCSQLASHFDRPWVLYVAALFHDVAKGRGGDHSELGAREARRFCRDHGIAGDDAELIEFLVRHHLTMSRIAQKEDLSDPDVIDAFAALVGNERRLTALYLLTVADIRGTSPKVWNAWKGKLLEDLYRLDAARARRRAAEPGRRDRGAQAGGAPDAEPALAAAGHRGAAVEDAGDQLLRAPRRRRHRLACALAVAPRRDRASRSCARARRRSAKACRCWSTRPTGPTCSRASAATSTAPASTSSTPRSTRRATGYALDTFQVISPHARASHYRDLISLVETQLAAGADADRPAARAAPRPRSRAACKSFPVTPRVTLRPDERAQRWLLGVSTSDRSGLLYAIARVLARHHINLQLAKITTLGRARRGHLPGRRPGAAAEPAAAADRDRAARRDRLSARSALVKIPACC